MIVTRRSTTSTPWIIWAGITLIVMTGIIHFVEAPDNFADAAYKGSLFVLNGMGALIAALGIYRGSRTWGWSLGLLVAGGAFVMYIVSRTVGLPGLEIDDNWLELSGVVSMIVELLYMMLYAYVMTQSPALPRRRA